MGHQVLFGCIGAWMLLISQVLLFIRFNLMYRLNGYTSDEARFFSLAIILFGNPLVIALLLFSAIPFWIAQFALGVVQLTAFRYYGYQKGQISHSKVDMWAITPPLLMTAWFVFISSLKIEDSIDGMLYHGPTLANILTRSGLWDWSTASAYSNYTDLTMIVAAQFARLTSAAQLEDFVGLPFMVLIFFLIRVILEPVTSDSKTKSALGMLILTTPVIWIHSRILYVDLAYSAALCTSIYLCSRKGKLRSEVLVASFISTGALMAIKPAGFVIASVLFALFFLRGLGSLARKVEIKVVLVFVASILGGLTFYLRNLIEWGNPFYPVSHSLGPLHLSGLIDFRSFASDPGRPYHLFSILRVLDFGKSIWFGTLNGMSKLDYDPRIGGFGRTPIFIAAILAVVFVQSVFMSKAFKKSRRIRGPEIGLSDLPKPAFSVFFLVVLLTVAIGLQPNSLNSRYTIGPYVLGVCLALSSPRLLKVNFDRRFSHVAGLAIVVSISMFIWVESHVALGYASIKQQKREIAGYNNGVSSPSYQQGRAFVWLPKSDCVSVYVHSGPGVSDGGNVGFSVADILTYGFFGNQLCNKVTFVSGGIPRTNDEMRDLNNAEFVVTFEEERATILALSKRCVNSSWELENPPSWMVQKQKVQIVSKMDNCLDSK